MAKPPKTEIQNANGLWSDLFLSNNMYKKKLRNDTYRLAGLKLL